METKIAEKKSKRPSYDFSLFPVLLHWIWTFPACIAVGILAGKIYGDSFQPSDNPLLFAIFLLLGIGGLIGFSVEFVLKCVRVARSRENRN